jgi:hypothetical protein
MAFAELTWPHRRLDPKDARCASAMLAADMAMRLRTTLGSSQQLRLRRSLNGLCFAHDHADRESANTECAASSLAATAIRSRPTRAAYARSSRMRIAR